MVLPLEPAPARPELHLASDAPANLGRTPRLERAILSFPDISGADLGLEVHTIELFEDVLDFVRDELHGARRRREEDVGRDEHTVLALENGAGVEGRPTLRLLEAQHDLQVLRGDESPALAVERQGTTATCGRGMTGRGRRP